jgi:DNA polymerase-3 subunit delta
LKDASPAVHAIVGDKTFDSYLAEEALQSLLSSAVEREGEGTVQVLRGEETSWARVLDAARSRSLFAERRAVVVRNADALKGEPEGLDDYLEDPTPGVTLVLLAAKPDKRRGAWKRLLDRASVVKAEAPKGYALRNWVRDQLRRRKLSVDDQGIEEIVERVGQDLRRVIGEIEKLEAYAEGGRRLSAEDVAAVMGRGLARPLYRLSDAFMARRGAEVLELMEESLDEGEPALRILATLHRALRTMMAAQGLREARVPREQLGPRLGVPPFKVGDIVNWERQWSGPSVRKGLEALAQADRRIKTGADPRVALSDAVVAACGGAKAAVRPSPRGR